MGSFIHSPIIKRIWRQRQLFLLLLFPCLLYLFFEYVPILKVKWAFTNFGEVPFNKVSYVGWANFDKLFRTASFRQAFFNTLIISLYKIFFGFPIPILYALSINEIMSKWYKKSIQTIIYFPHFLSWSVIGGIWYMILAPQNSINSQIAALLGQEPVYWFAGTEYIRGLLVLSDIWQGAGYSAIIYIAATSMIDVQLYEAAIIDGAGKFKQIWHVTLPGIRSTIVIVLILQLGRILNIFDQVLIMTRPIVRETADVIQTYAYRTGIQDMRIAYGMAVSIFKAVISFILVMIADKATKLLGEEGIF